MKTSEILKKYIGSSQYKRLADFLRDSEDKEHFKEVLSELLNTIKTMPTTYEQDGKGDQAIAYLHYFYGGSDWYITEIDTNYQERQIQAYGKVSLNGDYPELGYISIEELISIDGVEIDLYFKPTALNKQ